jgi:hypothetical protein
VLTPWQAARVLPFTTASAAFLGRMESRHIRRCNVGKPGAQRDAASTLEWFQVLQYPSGCAINHGYADSVRARYWACLLPLRSEKAAGRVISIGIAISMPRVPPAPVVANR